MVFDYDRLPQAHGRKYLPSDIKFEWEDLSKVFDELSSRKVGSASDLEKWLQDEDELDAYVYEQRSIRYINNSRQTDNAEYARAYELYVQELEPKIKVASFELLKKYSASPHRTRLPRQTFGLEDRRRDAAIRSFRVENVELEKQDSTLAQKYQQTMGAMVVPFRGKERTLQQMGKFLEETDRGTREEAWKLAGARALKEREAIDRIYSDMIRLRDQEARNAGFGSYEELIFVKKARFDYTPADCERYHAAVEDHIVPLSREIDRRRMEKLGVDTLRPWDLNVDPEGRPPLNPFEDVAQLVAGVSKVVGRVDPQLSGYFSKMAALELLDLDSRKGKAPGGYQEELAEKRLPFIFMNAARRDIDVRILLHEAGHSFHSFLMSDSGLPFFNANAGMPLEFAEVASTSFEIISGEHYEGVFYDGEQARRSNFDEAVGNVKLFTWVAAIDSFQHWVYSHPQHTVEERRSAWLKTMDRFGGIESYEGVEDYRAFRWQRQLHLFEVPFYYIEYAIALTGALGVWSRYRRDRKDAIEAYKSALALGATKPLPELFRAAGVEWGFGDAAMAKYAGELRSAVREFGG